MSIVHCQVFNYRCLKSIVKHHLLPPPHPQVLELKPRALCKLSKCSTTKITLPALLNTLNKIKSSFDY
jgi:hypothetical protein